MTLSKTEQSRAIVGHLIRSGYSQTLVARLTGLPKANVSNIVKALVAEGKLVVRVKYRLTRTQEEKDFISEWFHDRSESRTLSKRLAIEGGHFRGLRFAPKRFSAKELVAFARPLIWQELRPPAVKQIGVCPGMEAFLASRMGGRHRNNLFMPKRHRMNKTVMALWGRTGGSWVRDPIDLWNLELFRQGPNKTMTGPAYLPASEEEVLLSVKPILFRLWGLQGFSELSLDLILGTARSSDEDGWAEGLHTLTGVSPGRLKEIFLGDLGGLLIPRQTTPKNSEDARVIEDLAKRWLGVSEAQMQQCCRRAKATKTGGVAIVAFEPAAAPILLEGIRRGIVSSAVVAHPLMQELATCLPPQT